MEDQGLMDETNGRSLEREQVYDGHHDHSDGSSSRVQARATEAKQAKSSHEMLTWSVPLVIGFYLSAFYVVRAIGFVRGDLSSALLLLQEMDFLPTLTGMIASLIPFIALPLALGAGLALLVVIRARINTSRFSIVALTMLMLGVALSSWRLLVYMTVVVGLAVLVQWLIRRAPQKWHIRTVLQIFLKLDRIQLGTLAVLAILVLATFGIAWTAPEKLSLPDGTVHAYVIAADEDELLIVDYHTRALSRVAATELVDRELCSPKSAQALENLLEVMMRPVDVAPCDVPGI